MWCVFSDLSVRLAAPLLSSPHGKLTKTGDAMSVANTQDNNQPEEEREDNEITNQSGNRPFEEVLSATLDRRKVVVGGAVGAAAFLAGSGGLATPAAATWGKGRGRGHGLGRSGRYGGWTRPWQYRGLIGGVEAIPTSIADTVEVPPGYTASVIAPWGDPINPGGPAFRQDASNSGFEQEQQIGMGHDGIHFFPLGWGWWANRVGLLAINHEYTVGKQLFPDGTDNWDAEKTRKEQAAHGVSVIKVVRNWNGEWEQSWDWRARRITANTPTRFTGPAAGHRLMTTAADPKGAGGLGILNQCGNGYTPWGTYLTTEENFNGYFWEETDGAAPGISDEQFLINERYGVGGQGFGYQWATTDDRFRADLNPQEPNRFGWMVEIDPHQPNSAPLKHTAMGRFKHEGAAFATGRNGEAVVYMGDDQRFDYIYKFVGKESWRHARWYGRSPLAEGTLYVARFDEGGVGQWLPLVHGQGPLVEANGFADQGDVMVKARIAADLLGATPMDRPEWTTVNQRTREVFVTLTNNSRRTEANVANPRVPNTWGHIIKWVETDYTADRFRWDIFLLAGPGDGVDGSTISSEDQFGSPDGLWIDDYGRMWIQTDGTQPDGSNNQMLVADPSTREIKRFLTGPVDCEVTGVTMTPDHRTMFVNIQHPGDGGPADNPTLTSSWPDGPGVAGRPRPATVVITRDDGGIIGA